MQLLELERVYKKYNYFFLTFRRSMTEELSKKHKVVFIEDVRRNLVKLAKNLLQSFLVFLKERPSIVIANGGGFVVPFCYIAKLFRKKVIFIESFSRIDKPSVSGKLVYPISDLFLVQWKSLIKFYKKSIYGGSIF